MFWLLRKIQIPVVAFGFGMWFQGDKAKDACLDRGGAISRGICVGATE